MIALARPTPLPAPLAGERVERGDRVQRGHVADEVFDRLAASILLGELEPGSLMPPERVLAERFGVSRIIVRHAMHRLAELSLVRVKQGGATIVLDPDEATDVRVLPLLYKVTPAAARTARDTFDMIEKQYVQGLSMVEIASRRASRKDLEAIAALIEATEQDEAALRDMALFEERFWRAVAIAIKNRVFRIEVAFWYESLSDRPVPAEVASTLPRVRLAFYRELVRRLLADDFPVEYYLAAVRPILKAISPDGPSQRGKPARSGRKASR